MKSARRKEYHLNLVWSAVVTQIAKWASYIAHHVNNTVLIKIRATYFYEVPLQDFRAKNSAFLATEMDNASNELHIQGAY